MRDDINFFDTFSFGNVQKDYDLPYTLENVGGGSGNGNGVGSSLANHDPGSGVMFGPHNQPPGVTGTGGLGGGLSALGAAGSLGGAAAVGSLFGDQPKVHQPITDQPRRQLAVISDGSVFFDDSNAKRTAKTTFGVQTLADERPLGAGQSIGIGTGSGFGLGGVGVGVGVGDNDFLGSGVGGKQTSTSSTSPPSLLRGRLGRAALPKFAKGAKKQMPDLMKNHDNFYAWVTNGKISDMGRAEQILFD